jgi:hypothetical protein
MKLRILATALIMTSVAGCDINRFTNGDEWRCIDSERLNFKDPDSVIFIKNLGDRKGHEKEEGKFWIRYKAKNSYGAFIQENMACHRNSDGKWERDHISENAALMAAELSFLESRHKLPREIRRKKPLSRLEIKNQAKELVYTSPNNIPIAINSDEKKLELRIQELTQEFGQGFLEIPFGVNESIIQLKLGNQLKRLPTPDIYLNSYVNDTIAEYTINGVVVKASFQMDDETHLLQQVLLSGISNKDQKSQSPSELIAISNFLTEQYGPATKDSAAALTRSYSKTWIIGKTSIELSQIKPSYPFTVRYFMTE